MNFTLKFMKLIFVVSCANFVLVPVTTFASIIIKEIRKLILDLSMKQKVTVLVSSHILSEIQQIASRMW
jgi:ABC-type thiamine transport system ATPase subunit